MPVCESPQGVCPYAAADFLHEIAWQAECLSCFTKRLFCLQAICQTPKLLVEMLVFPAELVTMRCWT